MEPTMTPDEMPMWNPQKFDGKPPPIEGFEAFSSKVWKGNMLEKSLVMENSTSSITSPHSVSSSHPSHHSPTAHSTSGLRLTGRESLPKLCNSQDEANDDNSDEWSSEDEGTEEAKERRRQRFYEAHALRPPISPRDALTAIDDKKNWKQIQKFDASYGISVRPKWRGGDGGGDIYRLLRLMRTEILKMKPEDIPRFLAEEFFEKNRHEALHDALA